MCCLFYLSLLLFQIVSAGFTLKRRPRGHGGMISISRFCVSAVSSMARGQAAFRNGRYPSPASNNKKKIVSCRWNFEVKYMLVIYSGRGHPLQGSEVYAGNRPLLKTPSLVPPHRSAIRPNTLEYVELPRAPRVFTEFHVGRRDVEMFGLRDLSSLPTCDLSSLPTSTSCSLGRTCDGRLGYPGCRRVPITLWFLMLLMSFLRVRQTYALK